MPEITYVVGDATDPAGEGSRIIAHIVNDRGWWGRGFVMGVSARWPEARRQYQRWYQNADGESAGLRLGMVQFVPVGNGIEVVNMVGQHGVRQQRYAPPPIRYWALAACLKSVASIAIEKHASVHMPRIGCGLAGGTWDRVEPLIVEHLVERGVPTTVYDLP
jgi:O-acetyl-ADP-ribose deacetylase (regulator of RNase III)